MPTDLQSLCERGQQLLMEMNYWQAEKTLADAEEQAWLAQDWDTLARLYMPLQEARRQRRQRSGEGIVALNPKATENLPPEQILQKFPQGQLLIAAPASLAPAQKFRQLARDQNAYAETFLAAAYPIGDTQAIVIVPTADVALPPPASYSIDELLIKIPPHSIALNQSELPAQPQKGTTQTYAQVMSLWERLAAPYLAAADMQINPIQKMAGYRKTIEIDYACELAHQKLSDVAKSLIR